MIEKCWEIINKSPKGSSLKDQAIKDYQFYKNLGLTDTQSAILSLYPIKSSSSQSVRGILIQLYKDSNKEIPFSEFCINHLEEAINSYNNFTSPKEFSAAGIVATSHQMPLLPPQPTMPQPLALTDDSLNTPVVKPIKKSQFSLFNKKSDKAGVSRSVNYSYTPPKKSTFFSTAPSKQCSFNMNYEEVSLGFQSPYDTPYADTESYHHIEEHGFRDVYKEPLSTFRTTCNTASIGKLLNNIQTGYAVKPDSIRIEELMNFFSYDIPESDEMFNIHLEIADKPNSKNKLLFIGVKGKDVHIEKQNIVILLDVSGSMSYNNVIMTKTIMAIVSKLNKGDTFSLVTYSSVDHTVVDSMVFTGDVEKIIESLMSIHISGCTNGSAGIETAYKIAEKNYIADGVNKVVLITDGDLNFGINSNNGLEKLILEKKKSNVFLSIVGMGIGNYKDDKLETLAKNGNGVYCVINEEFGIEENILKRYNQFMVTIAKDVKAQVEFNPAKIKSYRLLGYENREIAHSDFDNDAVIAEPFGAGSVCVALYEIELATEKKFASTLKYQKAKLTNNEEYCTVSVRYKLPLEEESQIVSKSLADIGEFSGNLKLAFICYAIGERYRKSKFGDLKDVLMAKYLAETIDDEVIIKSNGNKLKLLKFLT